jgi:hypothetical protein
MKRSLSGMSAEEQAEGSRTLKADLIADLRHGQLRGNQELPGFFQPFPHQILMRGSLKGVPETSQKMITGEASGI